MAAFAVGGVTVLTRSAKRCMKPHGLSAVVTLLIMVRYCWFDGSAVLTPKLGSTGVVLRYQSTLQASINRRPRMNTGGATFSRRVDSFPLPCGLVFDLLPAITPPRVAASQPLATSHFKIRPHVVVAHELRKRNLNTTAP